MTSLIASITAQANLALANPANHLVFIGAALVTSVMALSLVLSIPSALFTSYMRTDRQSWSLLDNFGTIFLVGGVILLLATQIGSLSGTEHALQQFVSLTSSGTGN
jgi:hypothetical protein